MSEEKSVALIPFNEMKEMALVMGKTGMFGKSADQILSLMLIAQAEGIHPAIAAQEYDIIKGRPAINSRAALARFQSSGGSVQWIKRTDTEAQAVFTHPQGGRLEISWTWDRAEKAGLTAKQNSDGSPNMWMKYPAQMLAARCVAEGVRAVYPACLSRMYTVEEVQDFSDRIVDIRPERNVTEPAANEPRTMHEPPAAEPSPDIVDAQSTDSLRDQIKAKVAMLVDILQTRKSDKDLFNDKEKELFKAKLEVAKGATQATLDYVISLVSEYQGLLMDKMQDELPIF